MLWQIFPCPVQLWLQHLQLLILQLLFSWISLVEPGINFQSSWPWCKQIHKCFASCWYCVANLCWLMVWGKLTEGKLTNVSYGVAFVLPNLDEEEKPSPRYNACIRILHKEWKRLYDCPFAKAFGRGWIWIVHGRNGFHRVWDLWLLICNGMDPEGVWKKLGGFVELIWDPSRNWKADLMSCCWCRPQSALMLDACFAWETGLFTCVNLLLW